MYEKDPSTIEMKKAIGDYILDGYDMEITKYDDSEYGCPLIINFSRVKEGYFEETIEINVEEEYADFFGFDKIDHRVEYDYRYSYKEGRIIKDK